MIKEISEKEFAPFFELMAEIEVGDHFEFENPRHIQWLEKKISELYYLGTKFYGLFDEQSNPVGIAGLLISDKLYLPDTSELMDIGVYPQYRRKGYGTRLLLHAEEVSHKAGVYSMYIVTDSFDWQNIAFYGKSGFVPVATLPDVHGPGQEGHIFMRKILK